MNKQRSIKDLETKTAVIEILLVFITTHSNKDTIA